MRSDRGNRIRWDGRRPGQYEVYYLKLNEIERKLAVWLRYTLLSPIAGNGAPVGELWGIVTGPEKRDRHQAFKQTFPLTRVSLESHPFELRIGEALLAQDRAFGQLSSSDGELRWDLTIGDPGAPYRNFPWLFYPLPLPKTKLLAPHLSCAMSGVVTVNGESFSLRNVPGHQAHIWGSHYAERWAWANCNLFSRGETAVLEALSAQIFLGGRLTPPLTTLLLRVGELELPFNGIRHLMSTSTHWDLRRWQLRAEQGGYQVAITLRSEPSWMVGVQYQDPDGSTRVCNNTKVADLEVVVSRRTRGGAWDPIHRLKADGTCAFEVVEREPSLEVPVKI